MVLRSADHQKKRKKLRKAVKNNGLSIYKAGRGRNKKAQRN